MKLNAFARAILAGLAISATSISAACINVSVETDATYCIDGPICSGSGSAPAGSLCPTKGTTAVKDCNNKLSSWTNVGTCVAPADTVCVKIKTGAWGCVFSGTKLSNTTAAVTPAPTTTVKSSNTTANSTAAVTPAPTTTVKSSNTTNSTATGSTSLATNNTCINVSVEADATYCIQGPICSGSGNSPAGSLCPSKGAVAVKDCNNKLPSWTSAGTCVAPSESVCAKIKTGAWGCVYSVSKPSNTTTNSTAAVTPVPTSTSSPTTKPAATPATTTASPTTKPAVTPAATTASPTTKPAATPATTTASPTTKPSATPASTTAAPTTKPPTPATTTATPTTKPSATPASTTAAPTTKPTSSASNSTATNATTTLNSTTTSNSTATSSATITFNSTKTSSSTTYNSTAAPVKLLYADTKDAPSSDDPNSTGSVGIFVAVAAVGAIAAVAAYKKRQRAVKTEYLENVYHGTVPTPL
ncbi:unnamed protein product [Phytophthora fragariaefolia]|uniref:Unnamed protein product n=1 Tax=Phytophthora fragariaefolia TaxID=1490495 RepID=A0A9W6XMX1_9STRA|nr:unnamed protein product [Phytophthora fragariaefolia]